MFLFRCPRSEVLRGFVLTRVDVRAGDRCVALVTSLLLVTSSGDDMKAASFGEQSHPTEACDLLGPPRHHTVL